MDKVLHHKVVVALPDPLEPDSVYYVRKGYGFDMYVTNGAGIITAYELNMSTGIAVIRAPVPIEPLNGAEVGASPTLKASSFASIYAADIRDYRRFEVALSSDPMFSAPVFAVNSDTDEIVVTSGLVVSTDYIWRCRDKSAVGDFSEWSDVQSINTESVFNNYIDTPNPTPAMGAPFEGGFYMGMFWNQIAQSDDYKTISTGLQSFTVPNMSMNPIVYEGQYLEVRSRSNPANMFKGVVTGASGVTLTINVTSVGGFGSALDWSVMARFRNIVAPKSSGENASIAIKNANTALPVACQTLTEGLLATNAMADADSAIVYPAAHWAKSLDIGGYTDWHIPARDVLELCWRYGKTGTESNYVTANRGVGFDYKKDGSFGDTSTSHGVNNNSEPAGVAYTAGSPAQTSLTAFKSGGAEAFIYGSSYYWTSTEFSATGAWFQYWRTSIPGYQNDNGKTNTYCVRAVRRSII